MLDDTEAVPQSGTLQGALSWEHIQHSVGVAFVDNAYKALMGRRPTEDERTYVLSRLRNGAPRAQILAVIRRLPESRSFCSASKKTAVLRRIDVEIARYRLSCIPLVGRILSRALSFEGNSALDTGLRSIEYQLAEIARLNKKFSTQEVPAEIDSTDCLCAATGKLSAEDECGERQPSSGSVDREVQKSDSLESTRVQDDYWLPQGLRDFILDSYGDAHIETFTYWMSLIEKFGENSSELETSAEFELLLSGLRQMGAMQGCELKPAVSIVVPVHNALIYTLTCIGSILQFSGSVPLEILVGDDKCTDGTAGAVGSIGERVRVISQSANLGFLGNCNSTALHARGDVVVFLNNDTLVFPGWLEALIAPLSCPDVGLSGSKLINADGTLQEAGGIVWRDGSAWNYGRGQDPRLPEFNYMKEADYISGASIAMRASLWRDLGGFDSHYSPAYCEDTDLAFRVRELGLKVIYQPRSVLVHHEGRSHGRDISGGIKAYQVTNSVKFVERWRSVLERDHFANGEHVFVARDRSRHKPHILFIDHYVPQWDRDAGSRTMLHYLQLFVDAGFQVVLWPDNLYEDVEYVRRLQAVGIETIYSEMYAGQFEAWIRRNGHWIDYVYLSRPHVSIKYLDAIMGHTTARTLYYGHDLHFLRSVREYLVTNNANSLKQAIDSCGLELKICASVDAVLYPGFEEREILRAMLGSSRDYIAVIPVYLFKDQDFAIAERRLAALESRGGRHLMFVGGFSHSPNVDGICWFVREVLPILQLGDSKFRLSIVGSNAPPSILSLASDQVKVLGRISDGELNQLYGDASVAIVPLRYGGGVKGKLIEAMAAGIPIVSTSIGVQGIDKSEDMVFSADTTASAFAEAVLSAVGDTELARKKGAAGIKFLRRTHSTEAAKEILAPFIPQFEVRSGSAEGRNAERNPRRHSVAGAVHAFSNY